MSTSSNHTKAFVQCLPRQAHGGKFTNFIVIPRMLETESHFTPYLLICALGNLTMSNLAYATSHTWMRMSNSRWSLQKIIFFIYLFFYLGFKVCLC